MQEIKTISAYRQGLRLKILDMAMQAFAEKGIRAVKMDTISARLAISKRTLYELFANKEYLLSEGVKHYREQQRRRMESIVAESHNVMEIMLKVYRLKVEEFRSTSPLFYADLAKYPEVRAFLQQEQQRNKGQLVSFLRRGVEEGYFRRDVDVELFSRVFEAMGGFVMHNELYRYYTIEAIFNNLFLVTLRGFCTPKGVEALELFVTP